MKLFLVFLALGQYCRAQRTLYPIVFDEYGRPRFAYALPNPRPLPNRTAPKINNNRNSESQQPKRPRFSSPAPPPLRRDIPQLTDDSFRRFAGRPLAGKLTDPPIKRGNEKRRRVLGYAQTTAEVPSTTKPPPPAPVYRRRTTSKPKVNWYNRRTAPPTVLTTRPPPLVYRTQAPTQPPPPVYRTPAPTQPPTTTTPRPTAPPPSGYGRGGSRPVVKKVPTTTQSNDHFQLKKAVLQIMRDLKDSSGRTSAATLIYSYPQVANLVHGFRSLSAFTQIKDDIVAARYEDGRTATGEALNFVRRRVFTSENGARSAANKAIIIFTDGNTNEGTQPKLPADQLREAGTNIFAVSVGPKPRDQELLDIAGSQQNVVRSGSFEQLQESVKSLSNEICTQNTERYGSFAAAFPTGK